MAKYSFELKKQIVLDTIAVRDGSKGKPGVYTGDGSESKTCDRAGERAAILA